MEYWNQLKAGEVPVGVQEGPQSAGSSAPGASSTPMSAATAGPSLPDPQEPAPPIPAVKVDIYDWDALPPCPGEGNSLVMEYNKGYNKEMTHACQGYRGRDMDFDAKVKRPHQPGFPNTRCRLTSVNILMMPSVGSRTFGVLRRWAQDFLDMKTSRKQLRLRASLRWQSNTKGTTSSCNAQAS